jgi:hypothetical protein
MLGQSYLPTSNVVYGSYGALSSDTFESLPGPSVLPVASSMPGSPATPPDAQMQQQRMREAASVNRLRGSAYGDINIRVATGA